MKGWFSSMSIKLFVMDIDGTLTDGKIYVGETGELFKAFCIKDGFAIKNLLPSAGIVPVIITGRSSKIVEHRAAELGVREVYQGVEDKVPVLLSVIKKYKATVEETAYIGDDDNDLSCFSLCNHTACPNDASENIKKLSGYICKRSGGNGAVREYIDRIIHLFQLNPVSR